MSALEALIGVAYAILVASVGAALWSGFRDMPRLSRAGDAGAWIAAGLLLLGVLLVWGTGLPAFEWLVTFLGEPALEGPGLSVFLIAALAIPLGEKREEPHWSRVFLYLPAVLLAGAAWVWLIWSSEGGLHTDWITPLRFLLAVCAGLGARMLGRALQVMTAGIGEAQWSGRLPFGLLTVVSGSAALMNLWQRGTIWTGVNPVIRGGLAAAWLAWAADWLASEKDLRLRAVLTTGATILLVLVAARGR